MDKSALVHYVTLRNQRIRALRIRCIVSYPSIVRKRACSMMLFKYGEGRQ